MAVLIECIVGIARCSLVYVRVRRRHTFCLFFAGEAGEFCVAAIFLAKSHTDGKHSARYEQKKRIMHTFGSETFLGTPQIMVVEAGGSWSVGGGFPIDRLSLKQRLWAGPIFYVIRMMTTGIRFGMRRTPSTATARMHRAGRGYILSCATATW